MSYDAEAFDAFEAAGWAKRTPAPTTCCWGASPSGSPSRCWTRSRLAPERGSSTWRPARGTSPDELSHAERRLLDSIAPRPCSSSRASTCRAPSSSAATSRRFHSRTSPSTQSPQRSSSSISASPSRPEQRRRACSSRAVQQRSRCGTYRVEDAGSACSSTRSRTSVSRHRPMSPQDRRSSGSRTRRSSPSSSPARVWPIRRWRQSSFRWRSGRADELWDGLIEGAVRMRAVVHAQSEDVQRAIRARFDELLHDHAAGDGFEVSVSVKLGSGRKP